MRTLLKIVSFTYAFLLSATFLAVIATSVSETAGAWGGLHALAVIAMNGVLTYGTAIVVALLAVQEIVDWGARRALERQAADTDEADDGEEGGGG